MEIFAGIWEFVTLVATKHRVVFWTIVLLSISGLLIAATLNK